MPNSASLGTRIKRSILNEHTAITLLLGMLGIVLSFGFLISTIDNPNYSLLLGLAPFSIWSAMFFLYGVIKVISVLYRTGLVLKTLTAISGLWLWNYLVLSFLVFDKSPIAATEVMLIIPVICEVWGFTNTLYNSKYKLTRRGSDGEH